MIDWRYPFLVTVALSDEVIFPCSRLDDLSVRPQSSRVHSLEGADLVIM